MALLEQVQTSEMLHAATQGLMVPTMLCLGLLVAYAAYATGSLVVEALTERRRYRVALPQLIADLDAASYEDIPQVIRGSGLLDTQRAALLQLAGCLYLPPDALAEVAKHLLADERDRYRKALSWTESAVKVAPMLGLMGTLIPLGPGIVGLSSGDLETLSASLLMAFDTTVIGLATAVVCYLVTKLRRRWYEGYLVSIEGAMNTLLEKAGILRQRGFGFSGEAAGQEPCRELIAPLAPFCTGKEGRDGRA